MRKIASAAGYASPVVARVAQDAADDRRELEGVARADRYADVWMVRHPIDDEVAIRCKRVKAGLYDVRRTARAGQIAFERNP